MKKIFFIHIAKTAGSSFNRFLKNNFAGEEHCEHFLNEHCLFANSHYLSSLDYVSGHLKLTTFFENKFLRDEYFLLTFLREPNRQLLSHLNWIIHIYDISPSFFQAHPANIQKMCLYLREQNLNNKDTLIHVLNQFEWLFRNNQSRYFTVAPPTEELKLIKGEEVIHEILKLDLVGITEYYKESLELFIHAAKLDIPVQIDRENQNHSYRLSKDILEDDSIRNFLYEYNKSDHEVYSFFYKQFQATYKNFQLLKNMADL